MTWGGVMSAVSELDQQKCQQRKNGECEEFANQCIFFNNL